MKLIGRILIILLATAVVAGLAYAVINTSTASQSGPASGERSFDGEFTPDARLDGFGGGGGGRPGHDERGRGAAFGLSGFLKTLLPIALIVALFVGGERLIEKVRSRQHIQVIAEE